MVFNLWLRYPANQISTLRFITVVKLWVQIRTKIMLWLEVTTKYGTVLKGHRIRTVENRWYGWSRGQERVKGVNVTTSI